MNVFALIAAAFSGFSIGVLVGANLFRILGVAP